MEKMIETKDIVDTEIEAKIKKFFNLDTTVGVIFTNIDCRDTHDYGIVQTNFIINKLKEKNILKKNIFTCIRESTKECYFKKYNDDYFFSEEDKQNNSCLTFEKEFEYNDVYLWKQCKTVTDGIYTENFLNFYSEKKPYCRDIIFSITESIYHKEHLYDIDKRHLHSFVYFKNIDSIHKLNNLENKLLQEIKKIISSEEFMNLDRQDDCDLEYNYSTKSFVNMNEFHLCGL